MDEVNLPASNNAREIAGNIQSGNIQKVFEVSEKNTQRRTDTWAKEEAMCKGKLGKYEHFLTKINPEARDPKSEGFATRTDVLLISQGLTPKTPDFDLAKSVMAELINNNRRDVLLWTLNRLYVDKFPDDMTLETFEAGLKGGKLTIPDDFDKIILLPALDECEWVGHPTEQSKHNQTPLAEIVSKVADVVRTPAEKPKVKVEIISTKPVDASEKISPLAKLPKKAIPANENQALATVRDELKKAVIEVDYAHAMAEKKVITSDDLKEAIKKALTDPNYVEYLAFSNNTKKLERQASIEVEDINDLLDGKALYGKFNAQTHIDIKLNTGLMQMLCEATNGESLFTLCQYVVQRSNKEPNNNNIRMVALNLLDQITNRRVDIYKKFGRPQILENSIDLAMVYMDKPKTNRAFDLLLAIKNKVSRKTSLGLTEDQIFNNDDLVENILASTFKGGQSSKGNAWQLDEDCLPVFNSEKARPFLKKIFDASQPKKGTEFFYKFQTRLDYLGFKIEETPFSKEAGGSTYKLIKKSDVSDDTLSSAPSKLKKEEIVRKSKANEILYDAITKNIINKEDADIFMLNLHDALNGRGNIDKLFRGGVIADIISSVDSKPLIALCQSVVEAYISPLENRKNKIPSVALRILELMSEPLTTPRDNQPGVLKSAIDMAMVFENRPKDNLFINTAKKLGRYVYQTEERRFDSDQLANGFLSLALEDSKPNSIPTDWTRGITDDCLAVLNNDADFLKHFFYLGEVVRGKESFFYKLRERLDQYDYEFVFPEKENNQLILQKKQASPPAHAPLPLSNIPTDAKQNTLPSGNFEKKIVLPEIGQEVNGRDFIDLCREIADGSASRKVSPRNTSLMMVSTEYKKRRNMLNRDIVTHMFGTSMKNVDDSRLGGVFTYMMSLVEEMQDHEGKIFPHDSAYVTKVLKNIAELSKQTQHEKLPNLPRTSDELEEIYRKTILGVKITLEKDGPDTSNGQNGDIYNQHVTFLEEPKIP